MFRKLFGAWGNKSKNKNKKRLKQRPDPNADGILTTTRNSNNDGGGGVGGDQHPMYAYAMKEYAQTVPAETSNDDGLIRPTFSMQEQGPPLEDDDVVDDEKTGLRPIREEEGEGESDVEAQQRQRQAQQQQQQQQQTGNGNLNVPSPPSPPNSINPATSYKSEVADTDDMSSVVSGGTAGSASVAAAGAAAPSLSSSKRRRSNRSYNNNNQRTILSPKPEYRFAGDNSSVGSASLRQHQQQQQHVPSPSSTSTTRQGSSNSIRFPPHPNSYGGGNGGSSAYYAAMGGMGMGGGFGPTMPDTTYEESYGDAYVGGPIKYVYPSGYQSMRPRSGPWKLSIVVCLCFTWLSVFVIGHCSDKYNANGTAGGGGGDQVNQYYYGGDDANSANANNNGNDDANQQQIDDDQYNIETKWCGSRLLYWMWVISMLITGLATAYCSVIGYIKVRDFAVANVRSQPPGVLAGGAKSDYYVQITGDGGGGGANPSGGSGPGGGGGGRDGSSSSLSASSLQTQDQYYNRTIYQADGNPQFWGNQIYRPTQAAVAITSR